MKRFNYPKGKIGEGLAADHLRRRGYKIIEQNFRTRYGEIDLIGKKNDVLVFVEVKLKIGEQFGRPEEMISKRKINQVQRTAERYLVKNSGEEQFRIDVVAIVLNEEGGVRRINHYENVGFEI